MAAKVKPITARRRLELSQLDPGAIHRELMGEDVQFDKFITYFSGKVAIPNIADRIVSAQANLTIEGASNISIVVNDYDRELLHSDRLGNYLDVQIDGLWFRMTQVEKNGDDLTLVFQQREVEILRTYHSWKIAQRGQMTRAEFVFSLVREVKEFTIPVVIPELHKIQPVERYSGDIHGVDTVVQKAKGVSKDTNKRNPKDRWNHRESVTNSDPGQLMVKTAVADGDQINNANIILAVGDNMGANRAVKIIALMTAIQESTLRNIPDKAHGGNSDADSAGLFQQRPSWGSYIERTDPEVASKLFYEKAIPEQAAHPDYDYWLIAANVQHPALKNETKYAQWRTQAERFVNAYGETGAPVTTMNAMQDNISAFSAAQGPFYFYRGRIEDKRGLKIRKPENSWSCFQRLADEVDWRVFLVANYFYFISESDLFQQLPLATITEFDDGIQSLDGDYDIHKRNATITITAEVGRWQVPPGSVVVIKNAGPFNGRWLVNDFTRDLIGSNRVATITLKKPRPQLPEPLASNASDINTTWVPTTKTQPSPNDTDLASRILNNKNIHFNNVLESSDIRFGRIDNQVMAFMLWLADTGQEYTVTALKSDHDELTSEGRPSAHGQGRAVDIGFLADVMCGNNQVTSDFMDKLTIYQLQLGFDQLIGPYPLKCLPQGIYDSKTLGEHKTHVHVGWPI